MGITTSDSPCWTVAWPDGRPYSEDFEAHHDTEEEAAKSVDHLLDDEPRPIPKQLDHLCSTATTVCGYEYDRDDEGVQHWPDGADAFRDWLVKHAGYRLGEHGELLCPLDHGCDECNAVPQVVVPVELPGQMSIGEVSA